MPYSIAAPMLLGVPGAGAFPLTTTVWIEPTTYLPVKEVVAGSAGKTVSTSTIQWLTPDAGNLARLTVPIHAGSDSTGQAAGQATEALPEAAAHTSAEVAAILLAAGADPRATDSEAFSALRRAVGAGKSPTHYRGRTDKTSVSSCRFRGSPLVLLRPVQS
jgi:hypothetical protein